MSIFSRGHATLHLAVSVGRSVGPSVRPSVRHIFDFRAIFALLLLPNRPRLDCRVSGLVLLPRCPNPTTHGCFLFIPRPTFFICCGVWQCLEMIFFSVVYVCAVFRSLSLPFVLAQDGVSHKFFSLKTRTNYGFSYLSTSSSFFSPGSTIRRKF